MVLLPTFLNADEPGSTRQGVTPQVIHHGVSDVSSIQTQLDGFPDVHAERCRVNVSGIKLPSIGLIKEVPTLKRIVVGCRETTDAEIRSTAGFVRRSSGERVSRQMRHIGTVL